MPAAMTLSLMPLPRVTMAGPMPKHMTSIFPDAMACTIAGPFGKRSALPAIHALDKTLHQTLPPKHGRIMARQAILHSLDPQRTQPQF